MRERFVEHFEHGWDETPIEKQINDYAENYCLKIITIAPLYQNGIYVLFEKGGEG